MILGAWSRTCHHYLRCEHCWTDVDPICDVTFPDGHAIQDVLFSSGWYVDMGQARQVAKPVDEYVPGWQIARN